MGAAGGVTIYKETEVRRTYASMWPDHDIDKDWWYLKTCSAAVFGTRLIFDYADDQGWHDGTENDFWFTAERGPADPDTGRFSWYEKPEPRDGVWHSTLASQHRVLTVLQKCERVHVEVWT